jgi:hypothetical protein
MRLLALFVRRHEIGPSDIVDHPIIFLVLVGRAYGSTGPTSKTNNEMFAVDSQGCNQSYGLVREGADSFQDSLHVAVLDCRVGATALVRPSMLSDGWAQVASPPRSLHIPRMLRCFPATHDCQSE